MKKKPYRSVHVNDVNQDELVAAVGRRRVVVAVDVAKEKMKAAFVLEDGAVVRIVAWSHPTETRAFLALVDALPAEMTEVVMEPSGTYGHPLLHHLCQKRRGFLLSGKKTHDAREVFDGVPSSHDAKATLIIARLHLDEASRPWRPHSSELREMKAAASSLRRRSERLGESLNQLEGVLAEAWPEVLPLIQLKRAVLPRLLAAHPGPESVARNKAAAKALLIEKGGSFLKAEKVDAIIDSAARTLGVPMTPGERESLRMLAEDIIDERHRVAAAQVHVRRLAASSRSAKSLTPMTGAVTAAMVIATLGELENYPHAGALLKACGLNLRETSSGESRGRLKITKRGSGVVRRYLFMLTLRMMLQDPVVRAWYRKKVERDGGKKMKAVVAVMRKLVKAMLHVARGATFDATKLFDVSRLSLGNSANPEVDNMAS